MKNNAKTIIFLSITMIVFGLFNVALADNNEFFIKFSPENPGPNQNVTVNAGSYSFDINRANITWTVNGVRKLNGIGKKDFAFKTGGIGSKTILSVNIVSDSGMPFEKTITFSPADVDILWEAETYVPFLYKGKALPVSSSLIKITAMPYFLSNGKEIPPSQLVYNWKINQKVNLDISGYGKQSFTFVSSKIFQTDTITLTVSDYNKTIVVEKNIQIELGAPKTIFYKENPLEGIKYNKALKNETKLLKNEITLVAEPYFFSKNLLKMLVYDWKMNRNIKIDSEEEKNKVFLQVNQETPLGATTIGVDITNKLNLFQKDDESIRINY